MEFLVLGPLRVMRVDGLSVAVGGRRTEALLAVLLDSVGRVVSIESLIQAVWDDEPPSTATKQVQNRVAALRRILVGAGASGDVITTVSRGYVLAVPADQLDSHRFVRGIEHGRVQARQGHPAEAVATLRSALALWRGQPYAGVESPPVRVATVRLTEQRLAALEECIELELVLGRHGEALDELGELVAQHPLREHFVRQLMLALYRCGRQTEALAAYRAHRDHLVSEYGVEPDEALRSLHRAVLNRDPKLKAPADRPSSVVPGPRPAQLPPAVATFTGRQVALGELDGLLDDDRRRDGLVVITGGAGVGKSALAVYWSHAAAARFPDGQLFVNLRGHSTESPCEPVEALGQLLTGLGVSPEGMPIRLEERAALYRSLLAHRRMLVVLDNARSAEQVRPLLPGEPGCVTVVTSREDLLGLTVTNDARRLTLGVFSPDEASALLRGMLGRSRVDAEPAAALDLAAACAYLPLALRIAIADVSAHPTRSLRDHVGGLMAAGRLSRLVVAGDSRVAVRAAFDLSYSALDEGLRRAFRRLATARGADFTATALAALTESGVDGARLALERLARAHLVQSADRGRRGTDIDGGPGEQRYTFHDLLREYAMERMAVEEDAERDALRCRLLDFYLSTADNLARLAYPHLLKLSRDPFCPTVIPVTFATPDAGVAWVDAELDNLVTECLHAARSGPVAVAWRLADSLAGYFWMRRHGAQWLAVMRAGLAAARRAGDAGAEAHMLSRLGVAHWARGDYPQAVETYEAAVAFNRGIGDPAGVAAVSTNLALVYREMTEPQRALRYCLESLRMYEQLDQPLGEANAVQLLSGLNLDLGRPRDALDDAARALDMYRKLSVRDGEGAALLSLAEASLELGDLDTASDHARAALEILDEVGSRLGRACALELMVRVDFGHGRYEAGLRLLAGADIAAEESENVQTEVSLANTRADGYLGKGDFDAAEQWCRTALSKAERASVRFGEIDALTRLAATLTRSGRASLAVAPSGQALAMARSAGLRPRSAAALEMLAEAHATLGDRSAADRCRAEASAIRQDTGCQPRRPLVTG